MRRDARAYLWDAREATDAIARFTRDRTKEDFQQDLMLRSAVERQFEIIGEALGSWPGATNRWPAKYRT